MSVLNLDAEQGGGYNYDETGAGLQTFSDKAVIKWYEIADLKIVSIFYLQCYLHVEYDFFVWLSLGSPRIYSKSLWNSCLPGKIV